MKKFNEYIKEDKRLIDFISIDELEDQFLRLKEVFDCKIVPSYSTKRYGIYYAIKIAILFPKISSIEGKKLIDDVDNELLQIKYRLKNLYHLKSIIDNAYTYNYEIRISVFD
jgi:hypothetical protein